VELTLQDRGRLLAASAAVGICMSFSMANASIVGYTAQCRYGELSVIFECQFDGFRLLFGLLDDFLVGGLRVLDCILFVANDLA
jgi:hypothetical protein